MKRGENILLIHVHVEQETYSGSYDFCDGVS